MRTIYITQPDVTQKNNNTELDNDMYCLKTTTNYVSLHATLVRIFFYCGIRLIKLHVIIMTINRLCTIVTDNG